MSTISVKSGFSRAVRSASVAGVVALLATACGSGSVSGGSEAAATVNGVSISRSELESILVDLPEAAADGTVDASTTANFLSNWIFITALGQELVAQGYEVTQADRDNAAADLSAGSGGNDIDPSTPYGQSQIEQRAIQLSAEPYIAARMVPVEPIVPEYLCSSHILLDTREEADAVVQRLASGEDFATLAAEVSTGPSGPNGGDLGCVDTSTFVPEFIEGARTVAPSGVTGPVQSQFGFHVIKVRSMGPLTAENHPEMDQAAIDSAMQQANGSAQNNARSNAIQQIINDVTARVSGNVTIDPRYGEWDDNQGVIAPGGVSSPTTVG